MIKTSSDLPRKSFATSVILETFEKCLRKRACGSRTIWRILENVRKVVGNLSKIVENVVIINKTLHVACRYGIVQFRIRHDR